MAILKNISFTKKEKQVIKYVVFGVGGVALAGTGWYFLNRYLDKVKEKRAFLRTQDPQHPSSFAVRIKMSFENDGLPGTNVPELRRALQDIPSKKFFSDVIHEYFRLTKGDNLMQDLKKELVGTEYFEMLNIIEGKPASKADPSYYDPLSWARRLKAAFSYTVWGAPATDEDAIRSVLNEIMKLPDSSQAYAELEQAYAGQYAGASLLEDLKDELQWWEEGEFLQMIDNIKKQ